MGYHFCGNCAAAHSNESKDREDGKGGLEVRFSRRPMVFAGLIASSVANKQAGEQPPVEPIQEPAVQTGRNDPCPCGSGQKYKRCHRRL